MAGLGRKVWGSETVSSTELQGYLQDQVVMVFASTAARDVAIPAPTDGMVVRLADKRVQQYVTGSGWQDIGSVAPTAVTFDGTKLANFGSGIQGARVWAQGRTIFCSGMVKMVAAQAATTETSVATIPAGFRPAQRETFATSSGAVPLRLDVYSTGDVKLVTASTGLAINATWPFVGHWNLD